MGDCWIWSRFCVFEYCLVVVMSLVAIASAISCLETLVFEMT